MIDGEVRGECECRGEGSSAGVAVAVDIGEGAGCDGFISGFCFCTWMANAYIIFLRIFPSTITSSPMLIFPRSVWHNTSI